MTSDWYLSLPLLLHFLHRRPSRSSSSSPQHNDERVLPLRHVTMVVARCPQTVRPRARQRSLVRLRRLLILRVVPRRAGFEFGRGDGVGVGVGAGAGGAMRLRTRGEVRVHVRVVRQFVQNLYRTLLEARLLSLQLSLRGILPATRLSLRGGGLEG